MLDQTMSPQIHEIAAALAKAQAAFPVVKTDSKAEIRSVKGNRDYNYASLGAVLDAIRGPLAANGIAYTQPMAWDDQGAYLITLLIHTSGQWICSQFRIPLHDLIGAQAIGSYIAYARRYSISALTGLTIQDDDGHAAQRQAERPRREGERQEQGEPYADFAARTAQPREPGADDAPPTTDHRPPTTAPAPRREGRGKVRNGSWLAEASYKQGLSNEFLAIGAHLNLPEDLKTWTPAQVAQAIEYRKETLAQ